MSEESGIIRFCRWNHKRDTIPQPQSLPWEELKKLLCDFEVREEKDGDLWSPTVYVPGTTRANENVLELTCLVLDFDHSIVTWDELVHYSCGHACVIHTTHSHSEKDERFRITLPLASAVAAECWKETWLRGNEMCGGVADGFAKDEARIHYLPACHPARKHLSWAEAFDGPWLRVDELPPAPEQRPDPEGVIITPEMHLNGCRPRLEGWVRQAFVNELQRVATAPDGEKHFARRNAAIALGGLLHTGCISREDVIETLFRAVEPYTRDKVKARNTILWGVSQGEKNPRPIPFEIMEEGNLPRLFISGDYPYERKKKKLTPEEVQERNEAEKQRLAEVTGLPIIETHNRQLRSKRKDMLAAVAAANQPPRLFHGDTGLVVVSQDKDGFPSLRPASREVVQDVLADAATWISTTREGVREITPPRDLADNYLAQPCWPGVPPIDGIATSPVLSREGKVCASAGYNEEARLFLQLPANFALPDTEPTPGNVAAAKHLLLDVLLGEVAFADEASRAHAVALLLLPFVRKMIDGPTPLHLIDAPGQSSGKSYTAEICIAPFGTPCASSIKGEEEEWRKAIMAALLSGRCHIFFDNVKGRLDSPMLAAAITSTHIVERAMGGLSEVTVKVNNVWVATSNNAVLDSDSASRCIMIRLDTGMENPEQRKFRSNPLRFIEENRIEVWQAVFILLRAWLDAGRPLYGAGAEAKEGHQSRFDKWQAVMGGILQVASIPGFLDNLKEFRDALDPEKVAWSTFCESWAATHGDRYVYVSELTPLAIDIPELAACLGDKEGRQQTQKLGKLLQYRRDKVFGKLKICAGLPGRMGMTYRVLNNE